MIRPCAQCGTLFNNPNRKVKRCSRACYAAYRSATFRGEAHPTYKGRVDHHHGYIRVYEPTHPLAHKDGYVLEHRKVVHDAGIEVPEGHHVHHLNGDKSDNRLENLAVMTASDHHRREAEEAGSVANQYGVFLLKRLRV